MLTVRELIQNAYTAGLRNAVPNEDTFSAQSQTRALYISQMPDVQTNDLATFVSLYFGDAGTASVCDMVNLILRYDPATELYMLEIQPDDGDAPDELLAFAKRLGLKDPAEALGLDEQDARLKAQMMIAETRRSFTPVLKHEHA